MHKAIISNFFHNGLSWLKLTGKEMGMRQWQVLVKMLKTQEHGQVSETVNSKSVSTHKSDLWVSVWWICVQLGKLDFLLNMFSLFWEIHSQAPFEEPGTCLWDGTQDDEALGSPARWGGNYGFNYPTERELKGNLIIVIHRLQLPSEFISFFNQNDFLPHFLRPLPGFSVFIIQTSCL